MTTAEQQTTDKKARGRRWQQRKTASGTIFWDLFYNDKFFGICYSSHDLNGHYKVRWMGHVLPGTWSSAESARAYLDDCLDTLLLRVGVAEPPSLPDDVAALDERLSDEDLCVSISQMADICALSQSQIKTAYQGLCAKGLASFGTAFVDDGSLCGSGYLLSKKGLLAKERADYEVQIETAALMITKGGEAEVELQAELDAVKADLKRADDLLRDCLNSRTVATRDVRGVICAPLRERIEVHLADAGDAA